MAKRISDKFDFTIYKTKPLIRCGNIIYYGNISDKYVIKLELLSFKSLFNNDIADKVSVKLLSTDKNLSSRKKIVKKCEKDGLYLALDIADAWLSKALAE